MVRYSKEFQLGTLSFNAPSANPHFQLTGGDSFMIEHWLFHPLRYLKIIMPYQTSQNNPHLHQRKPTVNPECAVFYLRSSNTCSFSILEWDERFLDTRFFSALRFNPSFRQKGLGVREKPFIMKEGPYWHTDNGLL